MRYGIQIFVMLSDLLIIGACAYMVNYAPFNPITWIMTFLTFKTWRSQGEFMAWHPKNIRSFLANAKKIGL